MKEKKKQPGRPFKFAGTKIFKIEKTNPHKKNSNPWKSWKLIKHGMKFETYLDKGGRVQDLDYNILRGRIELK